jgi:hypothetical protein
MVERTAPEEQMIENAAAFALDGLRASTKLEDRGARIAVALAWARGSRKEILDFADFSFRCGLLELEGKSTDIVHAYELVHILCLADTNSRILVTMNDERAYFDRTLIGYACPHCGKRMPNVLELALGVGLSTWPNMLGPGVDYIPSILEAYDSDRDSWTARRFIHSYCGLVRCCECNRESMLIVEPFDPPHAFPPGYYVHEEELEKAGTAKALSREDPGFDYCKLVPSPTRKTGPRRQL